METTMFVPVTEKRSSSCQNELYRVGSSCMQGWRSRMVGWRTHILSLPDDPATSFFAVYDGHGGSSVSQYAGKHLHQFIVKRPEYFENTEKALKMAFLDLDRDIMNKGLWNEQLSGSTAVVVLLKDNRVYCANAGDSRAVACINGAVEILSMDHKPHVEAERKRICEGGGWVQGDLVAGILPHSRAFGDFTFKMNTNKTQELQIVTAYPDIEIRDLSRDCEFIVLACDGIWDVMTSKEVVDFCRMRIGKAWYPEEICEQLIDKCLAPNYRADGLGNDNMTVVMVCFLQNRSYNQLVARCGSYNRSSTREAIVSSSEEGCYGNQDNY